MSGFFQFWLNVGAMHGGGRVGPDSETESLPVVHRVVRSITLAALLLLYLAVASAPSSAQNPEDSGPDANMTAKKITGKADILPPPKGMTFTTRLDHTALWVGDQFHYVVIVDYSPAFEFVLDNLTKETVSMDPLQVVDVSKKTDNLKNNSKRLFVDLTLANFATGQSSLQIPQFTLYYFRKDRKTTSAEQAAAESLTVPGPVVGLRSTLPPNPADIRDAITVNSWDRSRWILPTAGLLCGVVLLTGVCWELTLFVKRRKSRKGPDRRKALELIRARWVSGVPSDFSDPKIVMDFYNHSNQNLKEYLGCYLETPTSGLTAEELQEEMQRLGTNMELAQKVGKVLDTCESFRYARDGNTAAADAARGVAQDIREILSSKS